MPSKVGIWSSGLAVARDGRAEVVAELEELGFHSLWFTAEIGDVYANCRSILDVTQRILVAPSIISVYQDPARHVAQEIASLDQAHPGRTLLGLGVSHRWYVDREAPGRYAPPLGAMSAFLDELDAIAPDTAGRDRRVLAALGPRMTRLAAARSRGAHPFLVSPEWLARQRAELGPDALLAPILPVVLDPDPEVALARGREFLPFFLRMTNYRTSVLRCGFTEGDVKEVSERLVRALIICGDEEALAARVAELHAVAGPNFLPILRHLPHDDELHLVQWRRWADALQIAV